MWRKLRYFFCCVGVTDEKVWEIFGSNDQYELATTFKTFLKLILWICSVQRKITDCSFKLLPLTFPFICLHVLILPRLLRLLILRPVKNLRLLLRTSAPPRCLTLQIEPEWKVEFNKQRVGFGRASALLFFSLSVWETIISSLFFCAELKVELHPSAAPLLGAFMDLLLQRPGRQIINQIHK